MLWHHAGVHPGDPAISRATVNLKLISCEILYREICACVARSPHRVDVEFLPKGLHDLGGTRMRQHIQAAIDRVEASQYDAILLGYGLCGNGLAGIQARAVPLVVARAHDCITLFFGDRERYLAYFEQNPGTYFKTTGWVERGKDLNQLGQRAIYSQHGFGMSYEELVARYGEDNARYLYETLGNYSKNYSKLVFIEMGLEPDDRFEQAVRQEARQRGFEFEKVRGSLRLFEKLVNGDWDPAEFLIARPGQRIVPRYDDNVIDVEDVP